MEFNSASFFCEKGKGPKFKIRHSSNLRVDKDDWPINISLYSSNINCPEITLYLSNEFDLIKFKNSVIEAYNSYRKEKGYGR